VEDTLREPCHRDIPPIPSWKELLSGVGAHSHVCYCAWVISCDDRPSDITVFKTFSFWNNCRLKRGGLCTFGPMSPVLRFAGLWNDVTTRKLTLVQHSPSSDFACFPHSVQYQPMSICATGTTSRGRIACHQRCPWSYICVVTTPHCGYCWL
jgi:hypothetical protein